MKKAIIVLIAMIVMVLLSSCSVEEPCNDWVTSWKTDINILHDGSEQIIYIACHTNQCVMISEEDYNTWRDISFSTTCWQDAENSI
jgi:hypothetical protein